MTSNPKKTRIFGASTANYDSPKIVTNKDKIKLWLNNYNSEKKSSGLIPTLGGLFVALLTPLISSDFNDIGIFSGETITNLFQLALFAVIMLIIIMSYRQYTSPSDDELIDRLFDSGEKIEEISITPVKSDS